MHCHLSMVVISASCREGVDIVPPCFDWFDGTSLSFAAFGTTADEQ